MNERIKELMIEAFDTAEYPVDQAYRITPNPAFCSKFAELIIQECMNVCDNPRYRYQLPSDHIREHFGIE